MFCISVSLLTCIVYLVAEPPLKRAQRLVELVGVDKIMAKTRCVCVCVFVYACAFCVSFIV